MLRSGLPIGRIFGISIKLHYSWFLVFALVTWALADGYFRTTYPDWTTTESITVGAITSILFFGSVLIHELAHSLVAKHNNIPIESITLFIFGGVSQIGEEPRKPGVEFRLAIAGPMTSVVIGVLSLAVYAFTRNTYEPVAASAWWLGIINLFLAAFNLIPGFPLDGGRVLRSIIWWRTKDLRGSTKTASTVGRVFGFAMIFIGILEVLRGAWVDGVWLAFIGWFLESAAAGSYHQLALKEVLEGHKVRELMTEQCIRTSPELTVDSLVHDYILNTGNRCFVVANNGTALGLMTMHNVKAVPRDLWTTKKVQDVMIPLAKLKSVRPEDDLSVVMRLMNTEDINQVPVIVDGNIIGMVTRERLLNFIHTRAELGV